MPLMSEIPLCPKARIFKDKGYARFSNPKP